ncbi:uncharacterized protein DEA37_0009207, partial [Paragonimus westermani]
MSTTSRSSPNRTSGTDDNNARTANDVEPKDTRQQMNEAETPSPISPGKYNINWDEIDESFNPFGSKTGPLKIKPPATKLIQKMTVASNSNQDTDAQAEQKANMDQSNHVTKENKPEEAAEYSSPNEGVPPYNTQTSKPLPDIFADKPLGATAKWDQVDWDAVDQFDDPSKSGSEAGAKLSKKSTGAKLVPTTRKKDADMHVSDRSQSGMKAESVDGNSERKFVDTNSDNEQSTKREEPVEATVTETDSPTSPGKYNINWDEIDESFNPFGPKAGPLKTKPPLVKPHTKATAAPKVDKAKIVRNSKDPNKLPSSSQ